MPRNVSKFMIGLFVTIGFIIGVAAIIWLGASQYFKKIYTYVSYFDESVQGLEVGSSVKYRGVEVGKVEKISIAPDDRLIEVRMRIFKNVVRSDTVAQLRIAGLSGIAFINLHPGPPGKTAVPSKVNFKSKYPVIPSQPSELTRLLSGADEIIGKIKNVDFQGISDQLKMTAEAMNNTFAGPKMNQIMTNIDALTMKMDKGIDDINKIMAGGKIDRILVEARDTLSETRSMITSVKDEIKAMRLPETTEKTNNLVENLDKNMRTITPTIRATSESLRRASDTLEMLLQRLYADPSDIIFSKPPPPRINENKN
jgi:phospholipid/cholesterol/gamma-HCH transport system substrate-binding protein